MFEKSLVGSLSYLKSLYFEYLFYQILSFLTRPPIRKENERPRYYSFIHSLLLQLQNFNDPERPFLKNHKKDRQLSGRSFPIPTSPLHLVQLRLLVGRFGYKF